MSYRKLNNYIGWLCFIAASYVYLSTIEPTASFWDCGEFITAGYRLEVGHAPGAPVFLLLTKFFTLFAGNNTSHVAMMANALSAIVSAATIMFLFWTITHFARKIIKSEELTSVQIFVIIGSGLTGAFSFMFTDTFWFSAVEGEVYATSSLFTAVVFWAILKWENVADEPYANRWIILIAFLMGLSIGVHLLNLLAIPAIVILYYFRKYNVTPKGLLKAIAVAAMILGGIMFVIIPYTIKAATWFELLFVNELGMKYLSGLLFYIVLIICSIAFGIYVTYKRKKVVLNTVLTGLAVILIGYSSYAVILIRSQANPPMDQNNPENLFNLLSYLNREQYGDRPLLYGNYFNSEISGQKDSRKVYIPKNGKYISPFVRQEVIFKGNDCTIMPRMHSLQPRHILGYMRWTKMEPADIYNYQTDIQGNILTDENGNAIVNYNNKRRTPTKRENIRFLIRYQLGHMYFRYFMWNFSGRQNDEQSFFKENINKGNWITGFKSLDAKRLGNQDNLTSGMLKSKSRNVYFLFPFILGIIGMIYHFKAKRKDFWVVLLLFFFTGIAIVLYLNQPPFEPRERDYVFVGSFYTFAIWIGLSVIALYHASKDIKFKQLKKLVAPILLVNLFVFMTDIISNSDITGSLTYIYASCIILLLLILVRSINLLFRNELAVLACILLPGLISILLLGSNNWDDHNRSGRTFVRDLASNYLNSCEPNAILFTYGDNDTYPLWYAQEVEGIRKDVRVVNLSYLGADWYIEPLERKVYKSDPIEFIHTKNEYEIGKRERIILDTSSKEIQELKTAIEYAASDESEIKGHRAAHLIPHNRFYIKIDSAEIIRKKVVSASDENKIVDYMYWLIDKPSIDKNHLMFLDILASNIWERPIYIASTVPQDYYLNLQKYFEIHGLAYKIVPVEGSNNLSGTGRINTEILYNNMMNKFKWGNVADPNVYLEENSRRMLSNLRINFSILATQLIQENKIEMAKKVMDKCLEVIPEEKLPYSYQMYLMAINYYNINEKDKALYIANKMRQNLIEEANYYTSLEERRMRYFISDIKNIYGMLNQLEAFSLE